MTKISAVELIRCVRYLSVVAALSVLTGCLPKETPTSTLKSSASNGPAYAGFTGIKSVQTLSSTKVSVTWNPSTDTNVVAYNIYDSTLTFNPKLIKTVSAPTSSVTLSNLSPGNAYRFRVRALDKDQVEDSNKKDIGAIPYGGVISSSVISASVANIVFNDASNADEARIYCQEGTSTDWTLKKTITNPLVSNTNITNLQPGTAYTCRVALYLNEIEDNNTFTTSFIPVGQATQMVFSTQPSSAAAGASLQQQPVVTIKDVNGTTVTAGPDATALITLTISASSPTIGTVRGTATVAAVRGVATFTGINFQEAGAKILTATKADTSAIAQGSGALTVDSNSFTISSGSVSSTTSTIAITPAVPPNSALIANGVNAYTVTITLKDAYGNPIVGTKPTFSSNIGGDTLTQPLLNTNNSGVTTGSISTTIADSSPARLLSISSPSGLTSVNVLTPFVAGPAAKLAFTMQPVNSPSGALGLATVKVAVQDAQGNTITTGSDASSSVSMAIAANTSGATLTGTFPVIAVNGVATFSDLGISKTQTGYKLLATSGSFAPAYSNSFNVTSGVPQKIVINGPTQFISGSCSAAFTIQLQDLGNNPANAIQNTPITLSGLGGASMYTSSSCAGTALSSNMTFTAGTATKTIYMKNPKAESLALIASDPSFVLTAGTLNVKVAPNKLYLIAEAPAPAVSGTPLSVVAGRCSTAITILPAGDNGQAGPTFTSTTVSLTGLTGSNANLYSDSSCTTAVSASAVTLPVNSGPSYGTTLYLSDPKSETLSLSVSDPGGILTTMSSLQTVKVTASNIVFTGPTAVISGACSTAYTVKLTDTLNNAVVAPADTTLTINGLSGSSTGYFYTSPSCTGASSKTTMTVPATFSQAQIYFKDTTAESLSIYISDPNNKLSQSSAISVGISPSALSLTAPAAGSSKTSVCAGPFTLKTIDGAGNVTNAISNITVALTGAGTAGYFYSDNACSSVVSQLAYTSGQNTNTFYFKSQYPSTTLTFTATDQASVLTAATTTWAVTAAPGFLGSAGSMFDSNGNLLWFQQGVYPVAGRTDAPSSVRSLRFDSTKRYLYVADITMQRVLKFDYTNHLYIGWIGQFNSAGQVGVSGSNLSTPSAAACVSTVNGTAVPGWCVGGQSNANGNTSAGALYNPSALTEDGTYLYVANRNSQSVSRFNATTGAFDGFIGWLSAQPTAAGTNGPVSACINATAGNPTPGWCKFGGTSNSGPSWPFTGNGRPVYPRALANDGTYLYVGSQGAILRYLLSDGSFQGWIGYISSTTSLANATGASGCNTATTAMITPGWCTGGGYTTVNPNTNPKGGINDPVDVYIISNTLYVVHQDQQGTIATYNRTTGAYLGLLTIANNSWNSPTQIVSDGTYFYIADTNRVIKTDLTAAVQGWMGKVANPNSMSGNTGCSTLSTNSNTPGWCIGGTSKSGMDEQSFHQLMAIELDINGNIITGQGDNYPAMKIFDKSTGVYGGTWSANSKSPTQWSNDTTAVAGLQGFDDNSYNTPMGSYADGTYLYVVDYNASRVKKLDARTGALIGWIGAITSVPTGGVTGCTAANPMQASPGWCTGAYYQPGYFNGGFVSFNTPGVFNRPHSVTGDGTYIYVTDSNAHRVMKFNASTGAYIGWIGLIGTSPTQGDPGCNGGTVGTFTLGWCKDGASTNGTNGDGSLYYPSGITHYNGVLYVVDNYNQRVNSYDATSGAFRGWIGQIKGTTNLTQCTQVSNNQYTVPVGWCKGGSGFNTTGANAGDRGGAFNFSLNGALSRGAIANDGTYLYIANTNEYRIDKWTLTGIFQGAAPTRVNNYTNAWITLNTPSTPSATDTQRAALSSATNGWNCDYPMTITVSGNYLYGTTNNSCSGGQSQVWKMDKTTGIMVGWQGGISFSTPPTAGDTGCQGATGITPGWCQNGSPLNGMKLGYLNGAANGISADSYFVYVTDENNHRVMRFPK